MISAAFTKKQIIFPQFFTRMISLLLDLVALSLAVNPLMYYITVFLFNFNFKDFLLENNLHFNGYEDFSVILSSEAFGRYMTYSKFGIYYLEIIGIQFILCSIYFIFFWTKFGTTPAKFFFKVKIVDYKTFEKPTLYQSSIRYISYLLMPISVFYVLFKKERRALHDIIAGTIAIKT